MNELEKAEQRVVDCAIEWWESRRPIRWGLDEHLEAPEVNCSSDSQKTLANAVADYLRGEALMGVL